VNADPLGGLYREVILDHHKSPRGNRPLDDYDIEAAGQNPTCGDEVTLQLKFADDRIADVGVMARGCAISTSSGSMLAEIVRGLSIAEARGVAAAFKQVLHGDSFPAEIDLGDLEALAGVSKFPVRIKCAVLPWVTLLDAILAHREGREPEPVDLDGVSDDNEPMRVTVAEVER
jgi:nitrogen fixation NifU-like protein